MAHRVFRDAALVSLALFLMIAGTRVAAFVVFHRDYPAVRLGEVWDNSGTHWIPRWPILVGTAALPSVWLLSVMVRDVRGIDPEGKK
jgi:hypothetical protein